MKTMCPQAPARTGALAAVLGMLLLIGNALGANGNAPASPAPAEGREALTLELPDPIFKGTPANIPLTEHMEPMSDKDRPPFLVPRGTCLLSRNRLVTSSDPRPITGSHELVTDGIKDAADVNILELHRKRQWVQIDLGAPHALHAVLVWHAHETHQVVHDVVVQLADDPDFTDTVRALFNNDYDNSAGLGIGRDKEYFEKHEGKLVDAHGEVARYVRCYSQGSTATALNRYTEVEVFGLPEPSHAQR